MQDERRTVVAQRLIRGYLGRRKAARRARIVYVKFSKNISVVYWNTRTNAYHDAKPLLLRNLDCGEPLTLANAERKLSQLCCVCKSTVATLVCDECDAPYCTVCSGQVHRVRVSAVVTLMLLTWWYRRANALYIHVCVRTTVNNALCSVLRGIVFR
jgi:hypothetical protein